MLCRSPAVSTLPLHHPQHWERVDRSKSLRRRQISSKIFICTGDSKNRGEFLSGYGTLADLNELAGREMSAIDKERMGDTSAATVPHLLKLHRRIITPSRPHIHSWHPVFINGPLKASVGICRTGRTYLMTFFLSITLACSPPFQHRFANLFEATVNSVILPLVTRHQEFILSVLSLTQAFRA